MSNLKRKRLPGGKWITLKISERESSPADLAAAKPEEIWTAAEGRRILVRDMDTQHILAVKKILEERARGICVGVEIQATPEAITKAAATISPIYKTLCA